MEFFLVQMMFWIEKFGDFGGSIFIFRGLVYTHFVQALFSVEQHFCTDQIWHQDHVDFSILREFLKGRVNWKLETNFLKVIKMGGFP